MNILQGTSSSVIAFAACIGSAFAAVPEPAPLEAYGSLPEVEDAAISPDGTRVAAVLYSHGQRQMVVWHPGGEVVTRGSAGDTKLRGIGWADDSTVLVYNSATIALNPFFTASHVEMNGTIIVPVGDGDGTRNEDAVGGLVFSRNREIVDATRGNYGIRLKDGRSTAFFGGIALEEQRGASPRFKHGRTTLYAVDLVTNRARVVARPAGEGHYADWLIDGAGEVAVRLDVDTSDGDWTIDAYGQRIARGRAPTGDISLVTFGAKGTSVIYSIVDADGQTRWFDAPLDGSEASEFAPGVGIARIYVDREDGHLLGYRTQGSEARTEIFDEAQRGAIERILAAFSGRNPRIVDWTPAFGKALVHTSGNGDSGTYFLVDVTGRQAAPLLFEREAIQPEQVGAISVVRYTASDGLEMDGILTLPPGREAKNLPVVMLPHGGPASHDTTEFDWWAQALASRGYAVFQPNFRGSSGRTSSFQRAGYGQWGRKMQTDISDGLAELVHQGIVDPGRACIVGASYGGYAALAGVTLQQGLYRCAVSVAGVADVERMYNDDLRESGRSRMTGRALKEELGEVSTYDEISPRRFADRADAPILLIHGKDDTVVPFHQSRSMAGALKGADKPYELVELKGEDHWLSRPETRQQMLEATVAFVEEHNPAD